jgi:tyrosinase
MWASWNETGGNANPTDLNWLNGPAAQGGRKFAMPMPAPATSPWVYTPDDVKSLSQVDYTYDDLSMPALAQPSNALAARLMKLGAAPKAATTARGVSMNITANAELVGTHDEPLQIKSSGARATVRLDPHVKGVMAASLAKASAAKLPDQVFLRLENVRGNIDAYKLKVSVNQQKAGTVALFGLRRASQKDGEHGGEGLTFALDISNIVDNMFLGNNLDMNALDVRIEPNHAVPDDTELTIGRVSVYRQSQQQK